jgi:hypothetical protein
MFLFAKYISVVKRSEYLWQREWPNPDFGLCQGYKIKLLN